MQIEVRADDSVTDQSLQHFAACCAGFELGTCRSRIETVYVIPRRVSDPRSGKAISCHVEVDLVGRDKVLVEAVDSDIHLAIFRALERAGWSVTRRLQRERHDTDDPAIVGQRPIDRRAADQAA